MVSHLRDISNQTVVVSLNENDQVWVRSLEPTTVDSYSDRYFSTFSIALIAGS